MGTGLSAATLYGGALRTAISSSHVISVITARWLTFVPSGPGLDVTLPDPTDARIDEGMHAFIIANAGSDSFDLKDDLGATLETLAAAEAAECYVVLGVWISVKRNTFNVT